MPGVGYAGSGSTAGRGRGGVEIGPGSNGRLPAFPIKTIGPVNTQMPSMGTGANVQPQTAVPSGNTINTSTTNPTVDGSVIPTLLNRAQGGMGAPEAIRLATGATRDALSGILKETEQNASRRGVGGSGAENLQKQSAVGQAQRSIAGQTSDISYRAEQDRNQLLQDTAGLALGSDAAQNNQKVIAQNQYNADRQANMDQQRINNDRELSYFDRIKSILGNIF